MDPVYYAGVSACELDSVCLVAPSGEPILRDVSWSVPDGGIGLVVGASGSGKSRLLRLLNRLDDASSGSVRALGRPVCQWPVRELRRAVGWVPQRPALATGTARVNLELLVRIGTTTAAEFEQRLPDVLACSGLTEPLLARDVRALSGGERQRVAIARVLLQQPRLLLLDEPTSSLDGASASALLVALQAWLQRTQASLVIVTHRLADLKALGGSLLVLERGAVAYTGDALEQLDRVRTILAGESP